jgi:hypothetical protein
MLGLMLVVVLVVGLLFTVPRLAGDLNPEYFREGVFVYGPTLGLSLLLVVVVILWASGVI